MTQAGARLSLAARPACPQFTVRELRARDERACTVFLQHLDPADIRMRFGSLHSSIRYLLPGTAEGRRGMALAAADAAGTLLGILNLEYFATNAAEVAVIVRSDHKRRGIGTLLLAHAIGWAESNGLSRVLGYVFLENKAARALVSAMGFQTIRCDGFGLEVGRRTASRHF